MSAVDSLLDGLMADGNKQSGAAAAGQGGGNRTGANNAGVATYIGQVKTAILLVHKHLSVASVI